MFVRISCAQTTWKILSWMGHRPDPHSNTFFFNFRDIDWALKKLKRTVMEFFHCISQYKTHFYRSTDFLFSSYTLSYSKLEVVTAGFLYLSASFTRKTGRKASNTAYVLHKSYVETYVRKTFWYGGRRNSGFQLPPQEPFTLLLLLTFWPLCFYATSTIRALESLVQVLTQTLLALGI